MRNNIDVSNAGNSAVFGFRASAGVVSANYSIGGAATVAVSDVGDVVGTGFGDQISFNLGLGDTFHLSSFSAGAGFDKLTISGRGSYDLAGVTGVENYVFGNTGIVMPDSVFTNVASGTITIDIFNGTLTGGQSFDGSGIAAGHNLNFNVSLTSYVPITGGAGDDIFYGNLLAGGGEIIHGGSGRDSAFITNSSSDFGSASFPAPLALIDGVEFFQFVDVTRATYNTIRNQNFVGVDGGLVTAALGTLGGQLDGSSLSVSNRVWLIGSCSNDSLKGGAGNDVFQFSSGQLSAGDVVTGGGGNDVLLASGSNVIPVNGISGVGYYLIQGGGSITLTDTNFSGVSGYLGIYNSQGGTIDGSAISAAHSLFLIGSTGTDTFTGAVGNDVFQFAVDQLSTSDVLNGGGGQDLLLMTSAGNVNIGGVSGISHYNLNSVASNNLVLSNSNLQGLTIFGITAGSAGDTIDASAVTSTTTQTYLFGGVGNDTLKAGADNTILASGGGNDLLIGGTGVDVFEPSASGVSTIANFNSGTDILFFSHASFDLGVSNGGGSAFDRLDPSVFSSAADGSFTTDQQRFAFNSVTHELLYAPQGSASLASSVHEIALLTGVATISANDLFYGL